MKTIIVLCALMAVVLSRPEETYDTKYDNFNAQELVDNERLLKRYSECFLDEGPCTAEGKDFKKRIPDALKTNCAKCSRKQRQLIRTVVKGFQTKLPENWEKLVNKEDPQHKYKAEFESFINASD